VPVIIDSAGEIVAGHTRVLAAKRLGLETVPCIVADDLTPEQVKAFRLADNKTAEMAEWDVELLNTELLDLEANFDMADFGFEIFPPGDYGTDFELPSADKEPFQQMTFMLANEQAEVIKSALKESKGEKYDNFGNQNTNGNALYRVVMEWEEQRK